MGCKLSKDELPYYETNEMWYFIIDDGQFYIKTQIESNTPEMDFETHFLVYDWLIRLNEKSFGILKRSIEGIGKVVVGKGDPKDPITLRINEHYATQRLVCIDLIEDIVNTFYEWSPKVDGMNVCEMVELVVRDYDVLFRKNRNNYFPGKIVKWCSDSNLSEKLGYYVIENFENVYYPSSIVTLTPTIYKPIFKSKIPNSHSLRKSKSRAKRGEKCESKKRNY